MYRIQYNAKHHSLCPQSWPQIYCIISVTMPQQNLTTTKIYRAAFYLLYLCPPTLNPQLRFCLTLYSAALLPQSKMPLYHKHLFRSYAAQLCPEGRTVSLNLNSPHHLQGQKKNAASCFFRSLFSQIKREPPPCPVWLTRRRKHLLWVSISMSCWRDWTQAALCVKPVGVWRQLGCSLLQHTLLCLNWLHISLLAAGANCTMVQPLHVPITSTQIEEERATAMRTTQTHPCRNDCLGMNTKNEVQFTRSKNLIFFLWNCSRR